MTRLSTLVLSVSGLVLVTTSLHAQDLSRYRDFALGSDVASVAKTSGVAQDAVKVIHQRPAIIQELRWRPQRYSAGAQQTDPVREVVFNFYNDKLYLIEVDYDRQRVEGLTNADLVESLTARYGPPVLAATSLRRDAPSAEQDADVVVATWADTESSLALVRGTFPTSLRLVVTLKPVEALARTASAQAIRTDRQEAPQRDIDRQKQAVDDARVAQEKARAVNKPAFKP